MRLRGRLKQICETPARIGFRKALSRKRFTPTVGIPVVSYGEVLNSGHLIHGGKVKLLQLQEVFPERECNFNILYLVSSSPPRFAIELVEWAKGHGVKIVWNQNGVGYQGWAGKGYDEINEPMSRLLHLADFVVYQSEFCKESADLFLGKASAPSSVLFNPVDNTEFFPNPVQEAGDAWRLLAAGTHLEPSRVIRAIECAKLLQDRGRKVKLTIAGRLSWRNGDAEVRAAIASAGLQASVEMVSAFDRQQAVELMQKAQVLVHLKYLDPCPTIVLEAMACGVPVVGSRSGGMPELVRGGGKLIPVPLTWDALHVPGAEETADAVTEVMGSWDALSKTARNLSVQLFEKNNWVEQHRKIFHKLIQQP